MVEAGGSVEGTPRILKALRDNLDHLNGLRAEVFGQGRAHARTR